MWYVIFGACLSTLGIFLLASLRALRARVRRAENGFEEGLRERQRLTGRLIEAQEDERRRVARELHDDFNQRLALLAVDLDLLALEPTRVHGETTKRLRLLSGQVRELSSAIHALSHQLHPAKLAALGLVPAVRGLCCEFGRHHALDVHFRHTGLRHELSPAAALCLYRVAQEALRNVVRHSNTDRATVELIGTASGVRLVVTDNGTGFDPAASRSNGGLGVVSMRERVSLSGGVLTIATRPAGGTRVDALVPAPLWTPSADEPGTPVPSLRVVEPAQEYDAAHPHADGDGRLAPCFSHAQFC
jgi:signal transduction histidine kinase